MTRPGRQHVTVIVNGRCAISRGIIAALEAAYRPLLPRGHARPPEEPAEPPRRVRKAAAAAGALFLVATAVVVAGWVALAPPELGVTGAFVIELRDFAVAAALASQAFGPSAATVSGVYGVLILLLGAAAAQWLPRSRRLVGDRDAIS